MYFIELAMAISSDQAWREQTPAAALSSEFLSGGAEAGLDKIRTRLLDLTKRNRLLNFKHSAASSLRVVDVDLDSVFRRLLDGEKLVFEPVPEPPDSQKLIEQDGQAVPAELSAAEYAQSLGWRTSHDLDEVEDYSNSALLRVLHFPESLEAISRKLSSAAKTAIEESGTNMLFLILGFLEWYESDDSQQPRLAPLVTVPVMLERGSGKGKGFECTVEYSGEDLETNLSLVERMRRDFALEIPVLEDQDSPGTYFARFEPIRSQKTRWRIRCQATLALLSFGKLLMYRDLDPKGRSGIAAHPLVRELFEGSKQDTISHAEEYVIDSEELAPRVPSLILDADSSQHSALIDALAGRNLVIEGPPGTGKSQTITNLIAAALAAGKTVLFVAEKLAALEVVRRRLDEVGLGVFCLELHSHKTRKDSLLKDLAVRIQARRSFREPVELEEQLAVLDEKKRALAKYASLLAQQVEPIQATVFEILWARDRAFQELTCDRSLVAHMLVPEVLRLTRAAAAEFERIVANYANHLQVVLQAAGRIDGHPWHWVGAPLSFVQEHQVLDLVERLLKQLWNAEETQRDLRESANLDHEATLGGLRRAGGLVQGVPEPSPELDLNLTSACGEPQVRATLAQFIDDVEKANTLASSIRALLGPHGKVASVLRPEAMNVLAQTWGDIRALGLEHQTSAQLQELWEKGRSVEAELVRADGCFSVFRELLGCGGTCEIHHAAIVQNCLVVLDEAPEAVLHLRSACFEVEGIQAVIQRARTEAHRLREQYADLSRNYDFAAVAGATDELGAHIEELERAGIWEVWFGRRYRLAKRAYRSIAREGRKATRAAMARRLRALADHRRARTEYDGHREYTDALRPHFRGVDSDWDAVVSIAGWYERLYTLLPEHDENARPYRQMVLATRAENLKALRARLSEQQPQRTILTNLKDAVATATQLLPAGTACGKSIPELVARLREFNSHLGRVVSVLASANLRNDVAARSIGEMLTMAQEYTRRVDGIGNNSAARALLGVSFRAQDTDCGSLRNAVQFAQTMAATVPDKCCRWVLNANPIERCLRLRQWLADAGSRGSEILSLGEQLSSISGQQALVTLDGALAAIRSTCERALASRQELSEWIHFLRVARQVRDGGFDKLLTLAESSAITPPHVLPAYRFVFHNTLARHVFADIPELAEASGVTQDQVRRQFADADRKTIELYRDRVAATIDKRQVPYGNGKGPIGSWTEYALVVHETNKQKRHIPIRQLLHRASRALQSMKPCFMMGPLSVAQYLAPGGPSFDLVVMDEASQLKPEDAIGAIARGGQLVVVGDPKQLPPTNFFNRLALEDDDDPDRTALEEGESILDVASTLYQPVRRLRWHYRSRHESLIAFSNREFYGDLVVFPSPSKEDPWLGVKYHSIQGMFERSRNRREADAVVEAVIEHMTSRPEESLGVATLNFEQRELIEELLDRRLRADPFAVAYQERMNGGPEPFFIKNLENVQGDERDVIFISVTYGPDANGHQYQRFGPINGPNGHRRLNVLFTRAKKRIEVFSSIDPDQIQVGPSSSWGLRALKQYLVFARTGILEGPDDGAEQPTNDFERAVGAVIEQHGFTVVPQVGVAGFFIDLAVRHSTKRGAFVLGVECDGATYHSGGSARDRDRLRQQILEGLGWKIHRIWSTDWFRNRDSEVKRLLARIEAAHSADPDYCREREKARKAHSLRERLARLQQEIRTGFADSPAEHGLLRPELLEEFLRRRPRTKDDWFRLIPLSLRSDTDPKQVGQYLPQVLETIAESFD